MIDDSKSRHTTLRRTLMVAASLAVVSFTWLLVGESEKLIAEERMATDSAKVLATVAGEPITESEVMEAASAQLMQIERQKHEAISNALDQKITERMLEIEARGQDMTAEEYRTKALEEAAEAVTQEEVDAFYNQNSARIRAPKEQVEDQIRQYLAQQSFFEELRSKYEVEKSMDPFRMDVAAVGPTYGPDDAPVTIIEFSDFECPFCSRVNPTLAKIKQNYPEQVRIVFRQFPLEMHPNAPKAAEASLCAHEQGKFWEMHDLMFADQKGLSVPSLKEKAAQIEGLDATAFEVCLDSGKFAEQVQEDLAEGSAAGVSGTPAFFVNGRFLSGAQPYDNFVKIIEEELASEG